MIQNDLCTGKASDSVWVIAFDKETGKRAGFTCCPKKNSLLYKEKYLMEGYDVRMYTDDELDSLIEQERKANA